MLNVDFDENKLKTTAVTGDQLKERLADLPGRVVLILDACHSAGLRAKGKKGWSITDELCRDLGSDNFGVLVMCAARGEEESIEDAKVKHGYFTKALIDGLKGKADLYQDKEVDIGALCSFVERQVRLASKDEQHPAIARPSTMSSFALSKVPNDGKASREAGDAAAAKK